MKGTDKVTVTCYGETETTTRAKAIKFYKECMSFCDPQSSEYSRYSTILFQLYDGKTVVYD